MVYSFRLLMTRGILSAVVLALVVASPLFAQTRIVEPPDGPDFLTRADFHLSAAALDSGDDRFGWDTHWGGEFDLVDFVKGRVTFLADYQAVLGNELQPFDPNQGNYTLTVSSTFRVHRRTEVGVVFNHVSRHLGDRPKTFGIAMNVLGVRWLQDFSTRDFQLQLRGDAGHVIQRAYVDYQWIAGGEVRMSQRVHGRVDVFVRGNSELIWVDPAIAGRSRQQAAGLEGGIGLRGGAGTLELFFGYSRVVDADPIDRQPQRWALAGFRFLGR